VAHALVKDWDTLIKQSVTLIKHTELALTDTTLTWVQLKNTQVHYKIVTEIWKITHMVTPETVRIFEFSMALLIAEATFKNISCNFRY